MRKNCSFVGPLAGAMKEHLDLLESLGHKGHGVRSTLRVLGLWLRERGVRRAQQITPKLLLEWLNDQSARLHPFTVAGRTAMVKRFFLYLHSRGVLATNPAALLPLGRKPHYLPHVFTLEDVRRLLTQGVAALRDLFTRRTAYAFFHLLYATGMRRSEALALRLEDVDVSRKLLHIRRTKFHKERIIPIGPRVAENLSAHLAARQERYRELGPRDFVFASPGKAARTRPTGPMDGAVAWHLFDRMLRAVGLRPARGRVGPTSHGAPRIHSLRHAFCVHRLLKWYREGADLTHKLFLLSTYVGHRGPDLTVVYLRATEALLAEAGKRFNAFLGPMR